MAHTQTFSILRATPAEISLAREAIAEVNERDFVDDAALAEFLSDPACYLLLATERDRAIGSLNGYAWQRPYRREPQFLLYEIDVREECRNRGVGRALVEQFITHARGAGAYEVWVVTGRNNTAAMAMYSRCGLRAENADDVVLSIPLANPERI